jgi:hypothetical protein
MNAKRDKVTALPHALTAADDSNVYKETTTTTWRREA